MHINQRSFDNHLKYQFISYYFWLFPITLWFSRNYLWANAVLFRRVTQTICYTVILGIFLKYLVFCILNIAFCFASFSICIESIWNTNDKGGRAVFPSSSNSPRGSNFTRSIFPPSVLRCSSVSIKKTQFPPLNMCPTNLTTFLVEKMQEMLSNNDSKLKMWDLR